MAITAPVGAPVPLPANLPQVDPSSAVRVTDLPDPSMGRDTLARFHYDVEPDIPWQFAGNLEPRPVDAGPDVTAAEPSFTYIDAGTDGLRAIALAAHRASNPTPYDASDEELFSSAQAVLQAADGHYYITNIDGPMWSDDSGPTPMDEQGWQVAGVERVHPALYAMVGTSSYVPFG